MSWAAIGIGAATAIGGAVQKGAANKKAAALADKRPVYQKQPEITENVALTESDLAKGMSSRAERAYKGQQDKALSSSLDAILKGGGSVNNVGDLYGSGETGRQNLAIMEDNLRVNEVNNVIKARNESAQEGQTAWQVNQFAPYLDQLQAIAAAKQQGAETMSKGIGTVGSAFMQKSQNTHEENMYDKYFGDVKNKPTGTNKIAGLVDSTTGGGNDMTAKVDVNGNPIQSGMAAKDFVPNFSGAKRPTANIEYNPDQYLYTGLSDILNKPI